MHRICMSSLLFSLLLLAGFCSSAQSSAAEPYCHENETTYGYRPIHKTRTVVVKPSGFFKFFKQSKVQTEEYVEEERYVKEWRLVSKCCEGYELNATLETCEPVCAAGCPPHATCAEPNRCQCGEGYVAVLAPNDSQHHCRPICDPVCGQHARCVDVNQCQCQAGYELSPETHECRPRCTSGCPNGRCVRPEKCLCDKGFLPRDATCQSRCLPGYRLSEDRESCSPICWPRFKWNDKKKGCFQILPTDDDPTEDDITTTEIWEETTMEAQATEDYDDSSEESDFAGGHYISRPFWPHQRQAKFEASEADNDTTSVWESSSPMPCEAGYTFYRGDCRPELFPSDEHDCHLKPCGANASCTHNGTCVCDEGLQGWHVNGTSCVPLHEEPQDRSVWLAVTLIVMGVAVFLAMLAAMVKLVRRQRGHLDVGGAKSDLYCEYGTGKSGEGHVAVL